MVTLSIWPLRGRIARVVARSTRATTVTSSPWTGLDRSVGLPGWKYLRGTKSSRSATVWMPRCLASGLADGWPTTLPSGVDRSATSLNPEQQRKGRLTAVDDGDLDVAAGGPCRLRDHSRDLRSTTGTSDHGEQLPSCGQESGDHIGADHGQILADDNDIPLDSAQHVAAMAPSGTGQRLLAGHRDRSASCCGSGPAHGDQVVPTAGGGLEDGERRDALCRRSGSHDVHLETGLGGCRGCRLRRKLSVTLVGQDDHASRAGGADGVQQLARGGTPARSVEHGHRAGFAEHAGQSEEHTSEL